MTNDLSRTPLGKRVAFSSSYDPSFLCPVSRVLSRRELGIRPDRLPFMGEDIWNCWELSWLDPSGKPEVAVLELRIPADSEFLVESKSLKLYLNSMNMTSFSSKEEVKSTIVQDLSEMIQAQVQAQIFMPEAFFSLSPVVPKGLCVDYLDWKSRGPNWLETEERVVSEEFFSNLLRTNCPVTGQPDWATISVRYTGKRIVPGRFLDYLISLREHQGFHEACVEMIFCEILRECSPDALSVHARFTRRGGIDINPFRSTDQKRTKNLRDFRQ